VIARKATVFLGVVLASLALACVAPFHLRIPFERLGVSTQSFADWAFTFGAHIRGGVWFMNEDAVLLMFGVPAVLLIVGAAVAARRRA
jgi:hypothetical protein